MKNKYSINANLSGEITPIKDILQQCSEHYRSLKKEIEKELQTLPKKGSLQRKKRKRFYYCYLAYRDENGKVKFDYIGRKFPRGLSEKIERRRHLLKQLKKVKEALYVVGYAKRTGFAGLAKRFQIFSRDNFTRQYCGRSASKHRIVLVVDHILPKKRGGTDKLENLITACEECNIGKHKHLLRDIK